MSPGVNGPPNPPPHYATGWKLSTCEGSARGRSGGTSGSGAAAKAGPTMVVQEVVGSVEGEGWRTTPSPARGGRLESWRDWGLSDSSHHSSDEGKGWKHVNVQVVPRMAKRILEDRLGVRNEGTV